MKKNRILSLLLAAALPFSMCSCEELGEKDNSKTEKESSSEVSESISDSDFYDKYEPVDIETVKEHVIALEEDIEKSADKENIQEHIDTLLYDLDAVSESLSYIMLAYYTDWYNEELEAEYDSCYENYYVAAELLYYAFSNGYMEEKYADLFEPYIDEEYLEYYTDRGMSMSRLEGYARVDYAVMDEYLDEYYEIAYGSSMNDDLKNNMAAEIYLELLSMYDTETFYDGYNRDFTPERILELSKVVREELIPVCAELEELFFDMPVSDEIYDDPVLVDNSFETINEYAGKLSADIAKSAELINDEELYVMTSGDDCYNGSFTTDLPLQNSSLIYNYTYGDCYDLLTAIHEFGHFHSSFYDDTTTFLMQNNIDIAEIQSQGMEMIFTPFYEDIYGDQAEGMKLLKLYDTLDSVVSGFIIGEFEYTVLKNIDTLTPEDVVECFDDLMAEYNQDYEFYYISHLFEQPGYYISYGVSALAALDIWQTSLDDHTKAVEMYENIAKVKCNSDEFQFMSALEHCGFNDVMNEEYIISLAEVVSEYAETIE